MTDVDREDAFEVPSVHDQDPIEALTADGADPPFDERVRAGCPHGRTDCSDALGAEHLIEGGGEFAVAVVDQKPDRLGPFHERLDDVACLLGRPVAGRVRGDASQTDLPDGEFDEHKHIQPPEQHVSTVKKSQATIPLAWVRRNFRHDSDDRRGAGSIPCGVRKVGSGGVAVFVDESAEAVASLHVVCGSGGVIAIDC